MSSSSRVVSPAPHHANPDILPQQIYFRVPEFVLESGEVLLEGQVAFTFWGLLNAERDNAIVVCHGLAESANVEDWWSCMLERANPALDLQKFCIICCNSLGSPFGSSSPLTYRPDSTGKRRKVGSERYGLQFPPSTFRDDVRIHKSVLDILGVRGVFCVIGHGMGNLTAMEWADLGPDYVRAVVLLDGNGADNTRISFPGNSNGGRTPTDAEPPTPPSETDLPEKDLWGALGDIPRDQTNKSRAFDAECHTYMLDKIKASMLVYETKRIIQPTLVVRVGNGRRDSSKGREWWHAHLANRNCVMIEKEEGIEGSLLEAEQLDAHLHSFFQTATGRPRLSCEDIPQLKLKATERHEDTDETIK
ncbi:acetyl coenzyme A:deacetylcephalosporin C o-acetyltransferase [Xylariaceae sp. FL0594]|nr:acetyl coenzyme A:deacetylcephalosporin C o-acetyltransferase [Xylariaceae sp. FL0594]